MASAPLGDAVLRGRSCEEASPRCVALEMERVVVCCLVTLDKARRLRKISRSGLQSGIILLAQEVSLSR